MLFNICYGNHGSATHIEDNLVYVRNCIRAAGHQALMSPYMMPHGYNVLLECFTPEYAAEIVRWRNQFGARFIIVATEFTDGRTLNPHTSGTAGHYGKEAYWQQRFDLFKLVCGAADAVWCMSQHQVAPHQTVVPDRPVVALPRAFDPLMLPPEHLPPEQKDIDVLFTGGMTDYRTGLLDRLKARFRVMTVDSFTPNSVRLDLICRAKANLHINLVPDADFNSLGRGHYLLMNKGPLISERARLRNELDDFIVHLDSDALVEQVGAYLMSGAWRTQGETAYAAYRAAGELGPLMKPLIDALPAS